MADEHIQVPPLHPSPADAITASPPPGTNGEAPAPPVATPVSAPPRGRRSLGHAFRELVWPSTGPVAQQTESAREVVETVVFVVVLVLLLKSFAAEAFVIPTGSMAQTLWGYQKVVTCPQCGHQFPVNASGEADPQNGPAVAVTSCTCPNCLLHIDLSRDRGWNSGDRVLVAKSLYDLGLMHPERHDVVVFKFPGDSPEPFPLSGPQKNHVPMNYIKRLIGLSDETIGIWYGKLYVSRAYHHDDAPLVRRIVECDPKQLDEEANRLQGELGVVPALLHDEQERYRLLDEQKRLGPDFSAEDAQRLQILQEEHDAVVQDPHRALWHRSFMHINEGAKALEAGKFDIIRKRPDQVLALRRPVYDNDQPARDLEGVLPPRWAGDDTGAWAADKIHGFRVQAKGGQGLAWLHYRHILRTSPRGPDGKPLPELITDLMGYNTAVPSPSGVPPPNWVGDLLLECDVTVEQPTGQLVMELSRGVDRFQARWDLGTGICTLVRRTKGGEEELAHAATALKGAGTHHVRFANVDERLLLWVDRSLPFGDGAVYK
ncbi:MAG TPA: S26 family signal peptidase, partial [Gemmataceae bacterium]|nr:S26 family signal peptidase [Gemmataceae bacterium]